MREKNSKFCKIIEQKLMEEYQKGDFRLTKRGKDLYRVDILFENMGENFGGMSIETVISMINELGLDISEFFADVQDRFIRFEEKRIEEKLSETAEFGRLLIAIQDFSQVELLDLIDYADCMRD